MSNFLTKAEIISKYLGGGWDLISKQKDTESFREDAKIITEAATKRYNKLKTRSDSEAGFFSPALMSTEAGKIGQKTGSFSSDFSDLNKVKSETMRALKFLDDTTSTVTGTRQHNKETRERIFEKYKHYGSRTANEEKARWDMFNYFKKNNPGIIGRKGEAGAWLTSDQILQWVREYRSTVEGGAREFMDYLGEKISEATGVPIDVLDLSIPEDYM